MLMFECPSCKAKLQVADENAGKKMKCPKCQQTARVPELDAAAEDAITADPDTALPPAADTAVKAEAGKAPKASKSERRRDDDELDDEDEDDRPRRRSKKERPSGDAKAAGAGIGLVLVILGVTGCCGVGVIAVLVALLVPAVQKVREAAARTQSINNLKMIGLAFHSFHDTNKRLPFNGTIPAAAGNAQSGSWGFQILPYMEHAHVFNAANRGAAVPFYMCPGRGRPPIETSNGGGAWTDYFYNNYINNPTQAAQPNAPDSRRTMAGITDGTSFTILVGHGNINKSQYTSSANVAFSTNIFNGGAPGTMRSGNNGEANPTGVTLQQDSMNNPGIGSWGGPFFQGALMAMGDGTVRMFPYNTNNFSAFLTPTGNERVVAPD